MRKVPIYDIHKFNSNIDKNDLYINTFKNHLLENNFIETSHSHNFYLLVLFTDGSGVHKIDFEKFEINKGSLFLIKPGQVHGWKLSNDIDGYIVFYSKEIYNLYFGNKKIEEYPFYEATRNISNIELDENELIEICTYFELLVEENKKNKSRKTDKLLNLIDIIHIEISRKQLLENKKKFQSYNYKMDAFNGFIEQYYLTEKSANFYASKMNMTLKHLNRICKEVLNKTVTELITQKIILESKRLLTFNTALSISEISDFLGYDNYSYFTKIFKKNTGVTPTKFRANLNLEEW